MPVKLQFFFLLIFDIFFSFSPAISQVGAFFAKLASAMNPVVAAISHPQYRTELTYTLGLAERPKPRCKEADTNLNDLGP